MTIRVEPRSLATRVDEDSWDELVRGFAGASLFQSATWARYERALFGARHLAFVAEESGAITGVLLASLVPRAIETFVASPLAPLAARAIGAVALDLRWSQGPLASDLGAANALVEEAVRVAAASGARRVGPWKPAFYAAAVAPDARGWPVREECTLVVDLCRSTSELWSRLERSARKAVRRAQRMTLVVEEAADLEELRLHQEFFRRCRAERGLRAHGFRPWRVQWETLGPPGSRTARYLAVRRGAEILAVMTLWTYAGRALEAALAQSRQSVEARTRATDLLKWWAIERLAAEGARSYDLGGIEDASDDLEGISRFKSKWGGERECLRARLPLPISEAIALVRKWTGSGA